VLLTPDSISISRSIGQMSGGKVVDRLRRLSGSRVLAGQHNRQPLGTPSLWFDRAAALTGYRPAVWGQDFEFETVELEDRTRMVDEAIRQWESGRMITLSWHACPPTRGEPCDWDTDVQSRLSDDEWIDLTTPGTVLHQRWGNQVAIVAGHLQRLQNAGVEVLWRPLHEINERAFWWGNRPGSSGSALLYQQLHDHMAGLGLDSLIWVWCVDDWVDDDDIASYWPGDFVDVVGLDVYRRRFPTSDTYEALRALAGQRPMALTEVASVPTPEELASQPRWTYWMTWAEMIANPHFNDPQVVKRTFAHPRTVTAGPLGD
jgi:mannan endo-1,4-beta-mannosidase